MLKAVIFDFDGLIIDTEICVFTAYKELYEDYGHTLEFSEWAKIIGGSPEKFDPLGELIELIGNGLNRDSLEQSKRTRILELVEEQAILPGVLDYIEEAKKMDIKLGIASSSSHSWVDKNLERLKIIDSFDTIRCSDDVEKVKPDPELFNLVLQDLEVDSSEAIVIEDSPNGIRAAQNAGIFCIAVPNKLTQKLSTEHADIEVSSLDKLPLQQIIKIFDNNRRTIMDKIIGFCGIICTECPAYIATQNDDDEKRKQVAEEWGKMFDAPELTADDINCDGCLATNGRLFNHCFECKIRFCGMEREIDNCAFCDDFACEKLEKFFEFVPEAKVNLEELRKEAGLVD